MARSEPRRLRRLIKAAGIVVSGAALLLMLALGRYAQVHFFAYQDRVDAALAALPPGEADPPPVFADAVLRTQGRAAVSAWVARGFVAEIHGRPKGNLDRHMRTALWAALLPLRLEERDMFALYAHALPLEGGRGLAYGARRYFGKAPADLTLDEVLGLLAIARAPGRYSPDRAPEAYRRERDRLRGEYEGAGGP